jgi:hypothetical protein
MPICAADIPCMCKLSLHRVDQKPVLWCNEKLNNEAALLFVHLITTRQSMHACIRMHEARKEWWLCAAGSSSNCHRDWPFQETYEDDIQLTQISRLGRLSPQPAAAAACPCPGAAVRSAAVAVASLFRIRSR